MQRLLISILFLLAAAIIMSQPVMADDDDTFDTGMIAAGENESVVFEEEGDYAYTCVPHPTMEADFEVKAGAPMQVNVTIKDYEFSPANFEVAPGGSVTWFNEDSTAHTATGSKLVDGDVVDAEDSGQYKVMGTIVVLLVLSMVAGVLYLGLKGGS